MPGLIEHYLGRLQQELRVSPPIQERILFEIEDHLREGAAWEEARGAAPDDAQRIVIERFGAPEVVARWWGEVYTREDGGRGMWQRFTERARRVVFFAQEEAARWGEDNVDTEHLLLGLIRESDSVAGRILSRMGIAPDRIREELERQMTRGDGDTIQNKQLTTNAKRVIDLAYDEARQLNNNYIGTEHLLVALIREHDGLASRTLIALGADLQRVRREVRRMQEGDIELTHRVKSQLARLVELREKLPPVGEMLLQVLKIDRSPDQLVDVILPYLSLEPEARHAIVSPPDPLARLEKLGVLLQQVAQKAETLATLAEGQVVKGTVRRMESDAVVVEIGGLECRLPADEISWKPLRNPSDVLTPGDEIRLMVLKIGPEQGSVTVGRRQLLPDEGTQAA
jgi:hypothetical protein